MSGLSDLGILLVLFTLAALLSVGFSAWAWIVGPAIKHLGRKWAEGKLSVYVEHRKLLDREYRRGVDDALEGRVHRKTVPPATLESGQAPDGALRDRFTITGRRLA